LRDRFSHFDHGSHKADPRVSQAWSGRQSYQGQIHDLASLVKNGKPDFVVATAVTKMDVGVPVFNGVPLLSNRGVDELYKEIMDLIDTL
jgi:hypothetical protein